MTGRHPDFPQKGTKKLKDRHTCFDNGSCFAGGHQGRKVLSKSRSSIFTAFESELIDKLKDKRENLHHNIDDEIVHHVYVREILQTQTTFFPRYRQLPDSDKMATDAIRKTTSNGRT